MILRAKTGLISPFPRHFTVSAALAAVLHEREHRLLVADGRPKRIAHRPDLIVAGGPQDFAEVQNLASVHGLAAVSLDARQLKRDGYLQKRIRSLLEQTNGNPLSAGRG